MYTATQFFGKVWTNSTAYNHFRGTMSPNWEKVKKNKNGKQYTTAIKNRDNNECKCCGSKKKLTLDHITPKSQFVYGTGLEHGEYNLVTLCDYCNKRKSTKSFDMFFYGLFKNGELTMDEFLAKTDYIKAIQNGEISMEISK